MFDDVTALHGFLDDTGGEICGRAMRIVMAYLSFSTYSLIDDTVFPSRLTPILLDSKSMQHTDATAKSVTNSKISRTEGLTSSAI